MKFIITLDRDEDGVWVAECPSIPGCVSQGKSRDEALENVKEAIKLCLEVRAEKGMPLTIETQQIEVVRQRGSHIVMTKERHIATLSIPNHKEVARGTLRSLIRAAGMTVEEFLDAAKK